ncbi:glycoside hydrolase family 3 N-terminal domain-containing protein [Trichocoleus sp. FACHB-262]|uniref:glycoside hydrolase family 3 protein n=1 Tax=Trichocoleus sp. FACHB-262 TaxID=2692869 RepID=UPI001686A532|nr:glycoside hydrolase family 3 N-terminal domain-containing protein [Trichocoleus sp. FACHB-262]MBD2122075.1 beta-glucosidase [Trichocoleus sp. FACHB-262]
MTSPLPNWESLSLAEQVAQMVVVRASGYLFDHQIQYPVWEPPAATLQHWVQDLGVGGVILLGGSAAEIALRSQQLQDWAQIPLLIAADIEEGVGQRFSGATWFPPPMALNAIAQTNLAQALHYAEAMGAYTAQEALAIGLNWVLAPTVDVNNNPNNPVINVRAFGETPETVSKLATAFIQGAQQHPVLTAAKHFPGHGDTATDSHLDLPVLTHSEKRFAEIELPPFKSAIAAGVDAVMSAHLQIPAWDAQFPATLSHRILTQELRRNLGFEGLIVTDALVMGAIANRYGVNEAPVLAVEAGADILLMPLDPAGAIKAVCEAVETGRITPERIQASVERIWRAKFKVCSPMPESADITHAWENLPPPPIQLEQLSTPEAIATVNGILQDSMQMHLPKESRLSQPSEGQLRNVVIVDDALACEFLGRYTPAIALPQNKGYHLQLVDSHTPAIAFESQLTTPQPTLLQLFIRGNPFRGSAGLTQTAQDWFKFLLETNQLQALVIYGSPYAVEKFIPHLPADVPYVFTYGQMPAAQAIALDALFHPQA